MAQRVEHCRLVGTGITTLGRTGLSEDKGDTTGNEFRAWDYLEREGWELVSGGLFQAPHREAIATDH
jgi:hypothetical protein